MTPIQQLMLGAGGVKKKTYMDDLFSTYVYTGTNSQRTLNVGIDFTTKGGATFIKNRDESESWAIFDTVRGNGKLLHFNSNAAQSESFARQNNFSTTGFDVGAEAQTNGSSDKMVSFNCRKAKGFFDVVTYNGSSSAQTISHSLGCQPGMIMVKKTSGTDSWAVWHRSLSNTAQGNLALNTTAASGNDSTIWNNTAPTSSVFSVGQNGVVNENGATYVAYLFAGGESTAATARCVEMDGTGDYFTTSTSSDYDFGTGDFTVETWVRIDEDYVTSNNYPTVLDGRTDGSYGNFWVVYVNPGDKKIYFYNAGANRIGSNISIERDVWYHIAVVRNSAVTEFYVNGISQGTYSDSTDYSHTSIVWGSNGVSLGSYVFNGAFSNLRVVKGTAVYTSSFKPPTEPLTNITNTKLLCFNNASTTGTTVGTITASGNPTASTDSPFDDPAGFKFGENEDQNVIKCGSYKGSGSAGLKVNLGWEPSFVMIKAVETSSTNWFVFDSMRGLVTAGDGGFNYANTTAADVAGEYLEVYPQGFRVKSTTDGLNESTKKLVYIAIRRSDGYVGKIPEAGTDVFRLATGQSGASAPNYPGGIVVDYHITRDIDSTNSFYTGARMIGTKYLTTDGGSATATSATWVYDYMNGYNSGSSASDWKSWQWKRHAGFDVLTYNSNGTQGYTIPHSLGRVPEMIWFKNLDQSWNWNVYHKGANGGTDPQKRHLRLNHNHAEVNLTEHGMTTADFMDDKMPTATHFALGDGANPNSGTDKNIALLFASVDGISKVGSYTGNGSATSRTITLGFQPRFLIIKRTDDYGNWLVLDSTLGWGSGDDHRIWLDGTWPGETSINVGAPTSTGFTLTTTHNNINANTGNYVYYAHA
jgi:hypothetical protein